MTNLEYLTKADTEEIREKFCGEFMGIIENAVYENHDIVAHMCDLCPFSYRCSEGHNGFIEWAREERVEY